MPLKPIVVVGSINMDLVSRTPHIPKPGETVIGSDFQMHTGGKGANQAVAAARLGCPCTLLGMTGKDVFGPTLLQALREYGVDTSHIETAEAPSGTASICVDDNGENCIIVTPGANFNVSIAYLQRKMEVLRGAGIVLAQLEIPLDVVEWLASTCQQLEVPFMLDPAPARTLPPELLANVDWFTPNETEAAFYVPEARSEDDLIPCLLASGVRGVVLKRGERGAVLHHAPTYLRQVVPGFPVTAVDTTAAGDAFNGAFAVSLMSGFPEPESARRACAAAALSVQKQGAQPSMASAQELTDFLARIDGSST